MTIPDRTDELVRAMLQRRASEPMPDWLFDRTMHAIVKAPRARTSRWPWQVPPSTAGRLALVAAMALVFTLLAAGALLAAGVLHLPPAPPRFPAAVVAAPSPSPSVESSFDTAPVPEPTPPVTPKPVPPALAADSLAVVTAAGDGLRVRTAPGVGADSKKLSPLLPKGTRMFIVGGPVAADGYEWYEIRTDTFGGGIDLYGWVAAAHKDGGAWIKPTAAACPAELDAYAIAETSPMDLLACYGDAQFDVVVRAVFSPTDIEVESCPWSPGHGACSLEPSWMGQPIDLFVGELKSEPGDLGGVLTASAVVAPEAQAAAAAAAAAYATDVRVTLSADAPEAQDCRFLDESGTEVGDRAQAVLECRLRLVVRDLEWEAQPVRELPTNLLAAGGTDGLELWSSPREAVQVVEGRIAPDAILYVDQRWPEIGPAEWYAVLNWDPQDPRYGWVKAPTDNEQLMPVEPDCVPMTDWSAFLELDRLERLVCTPEEPVTLDMYAWAMQPANPAWSDGCSAWSYLPSSGGGVCQATPEWLATFSGVMMRRPGDMEMSATYDPSVLDRSAFPTSETWVKVTGTWRSPASSECRVRDATTGTDLLPPEQAAIYCRATFVITGIGPATTSP